MNSKRVFQIVAEESYPEGNEIALDGHPAMSDMKVMQFGQAGRCDAHRSSQPQNY